MAELKLRIGADGSTKIEVSGVVGKSCEDITKAIEQALGKETSRKRKPEYYKGVSHVHAKN